ncbi:MAG: M20/M25/M40 family metallo-hydrolase [Acidobacteria bacterium]|nr:M20/M25/M40 family metallo-hydrolase [Acidobacteriota bacterium]
MMEQWFRHLSAASLMCVLLAPVAHSQPAQGAQAESRAQSGQAPEAPPQPRAAFDKGKLFTVNQAARAGVPAAGPPDASITAALRAISAGRIRQNIEKLASFVNRNTNGSRNPELAQKGMGIVAAREWIRSQFEAYSSECGGCLEVKDDTFTAQPGNTPEGQAQAGSTAAPSPQAGGGRQPAPRIDAPTELVNVYAVLRGTDPAQASRIYLVSGHYDSFYASAAPSTTSARNMLDVNGPAPGANDDASGTAVSLECARVLSRHKFPATIIFLTVAGEEQGLVGSRHFAQMAKQEAWNIAAMLNNDIVGGNRTPGEEARQNPHAVRVFSEGLPLSATPQEIRTIRQNGYENDSPSRQLARYIREAATTYRLVLGNGTFAPLLIWRPDRFGRGGDHTPFNEQGYAAVRFTEYREDFNHQHQLVRTEGGVEYGDIPKFVDFSYVANVARVNAATLASLAEAPASPGNVRFPAGAGSNQTTIAWDAPAGSSGVTYEILWRETTAPYWQHALDVGESTRVTIDLSKDNVIFGVRGKDSKGHRSPAVVPRAERRPAVAPAE